MFTTLRFVSRLCNLRLRRELVRGACSTAATSYVVFQAIPTASPKQLLKTYHGALQGRPKHCGALRGLPRPYHRNTFFRGLAGPPMYGSGAFCWGGILLVLGVSNTDLSQNVAPTPDHPHIRQAVYAVSRRSFRLLWKDRVPLEISRRLFQHLVGLGPARPN